MLTRHLHVDSLGGAEFMNTALKVAFATSDMATVNQHFGSAKSVSYTHLTLPTILRV